MEGIEGQLSEALRLLAVNAKKPPPSRGGRVRLILGRRGPEHSRRASDSLLSTSAAFEDEVVQDN
jgi:hypothetical protein